jgi:hypothetical protein
MPRIPSTSLSILVLSKWAISLTLLVPIALLDAAIATPQTTWRSVFLNWLGNEPKDRGNGGNSGGRPVDELCVIAPNSGNSIWTTQPLFVWQGNYRVIGVRLAGDNPVFWWKTVSTPNQAVLDQAANRLRYTGKALVPGTAYEWVFFVDQNRRSPIASVPFKVMDRKKHALITADLAKLDAKRKAAGESNESRALQRAPKKQAHVLEYQKLDRPQA